jgi:hypothetical protein
LASGTAVSGKNRIRKRPKSFKGQRSKILTGASVLGRGRLNPGKWACWTPKVREIWPGLRLACRSGRAWDVGDQPICCNVIAVGPFSVGLN